MNLIKKTIFVVSALLILFPQTALAKKKRGGGIGLVILEALRRNPESRGSIFMCRQNMQSNDFYVFSVRATHDAGFEKTDADYSCRGIDWAEVARRHECLKPQLEQSKAEAKTMLASLSEKPGFSVRVRVHSDNGETHFQNSWGDALVSWLPTMNAYASENDCDLQVTLELHGPNSGEG